MRSSLEALGVSVAGKVNAEEGGGDMGLDGLAAFGKGSDIQGTCWQSPHFYYPGVSPAQVRIGIDEPGFMERLTGHEVSYIV